MIFKSLFGNCPICEGSYKNHKAALLNAIPNDGSDFQIEFLKSVENRAWKEVLLTQGDENPEYYPFVILALRCTNSQIAVVIMGYEEAFIPVQYVFSYQVLDLEESKLLEQELTPHQWIFIDGKLMEIKRKVEKILESKVKLS